MGSLFEAVRHVTALEAAERLGLGIKHNGSKHWVCCPLHGEKTPSLCIYDSGTWYCFGCHKGGDTVRLYQELYGLEPYPAAVQLAEDFGIPISDTEKPVKREKPKPSVFDLERALEKKRTKEWTRLCDAVHRADSVLDKYATPCDAVWEQKEFMTALQARTYANQLLDWLQQASLVELADEYREALNDTGRTSCAGSTYAGRVAT